MVLWNSSTELSYKEDIKKKIKDKAGSEEQIKVKEGAEAIHTFMRTPNQSRLGPSIKAGCRTALFHTTDDYRDIQKLMHVYIYPYIAFLPCHYA